MNMLDAYIIDDLKRREREEQDGVRTPVHIEVPMGEELPEERGDDHEKPDDDGGVVIIDHSVRGAVTGMLDC